MTGKILSVGGSGLVLSDGLGRKDEDGKEIGTELTIAPDCVVKIDDNEAEVSDLLEGDLVTCTDACIDDTFEQHVVSIVADR
jgi:hypothetical protein